MKREKSEHVDTEAMQNGSAVTTPHPTSDSYGAKARRTPKRPVKLAESVAREIVHDIVTRKLEPGTRLPPESVMLEDYGVGRNSLREALRILEIHGFIRIKSGPGGGPVVGQSRSDELGRMMTLYFHLQRATFGELMQARYVVEPMMARLAAERRHPDALTELRTSISRAAEVPLDDDHAWLEAATEFHDIVAGMSGNRVLGLIGRALKDIYYDRFRIAVTGTLDAREHVRGVHEAISDAILAGDGNEAERLMQTHLEEWIDNVEARSPGLFDDIVSWQ